jgi:hypothetical protein
MARVLATCALALALASCAAAQSSVLNSNSKANATYAAYTGYNATGFQDTNAYYGPYSAVSATTSTGTKPNVSISVQPEGCTILSRQFGIANYSGDLPCAPPGMPASDSKPACVVRARLVLRGGQCRACLAEHGSKQELCLCQEQPEGKVTLAHSEMVAKCVRSRRLEAGAVLCKLALWNTRLVLCIKEVVCCWIAQNITGKICVVTGASTGIGRASADRLAAAGAVVVGAQS